MNQTINQTPLCAQATRGLSHRCEPPPVVLPQVAVKHDFHCPAWCICRGATRHPHCVPHCAHTHALDARTHSSDTVAPATTSVAAPGFACACTCSGVPGDAGTSATTRPRLNVLRQANNTRQRNAPRRAATHPTPRLITSHHVASHYITRHNAPHTAAARTTHITQIARRTANKRIPSHHSGPHTTPLLITSRHTHITLPRAPQMAAAPLSGKNVTSGAAVDGTAARARIARPSPVNRVPAAAIGEYITVSAAAIGECITVRRQR